MSNSNLRRMMMAQSASAPSEDWDYEWDWKSGTMPPMATWNTAEKVSDGIAFSGFKLKFADVCEDATIRVKMYQLSHDSGQPFSIILRYASRDGAKAYMGASGQQRIRSNVPGKTEETSTGPYEMHEIELSLKSRQFELKIDGITEQTGPGVKNNNYLGYCGFVNLGAQYVISEIKWRGK